MKIYLFKAILIAWIINCCNTPIFAQRESIPEFAATMQAQKNIPALGKSIGQYTILHFPATQLARFLKGKSDAEVALNFGNMATWDVALQPSNIVASGYQFTMQTPGGKETFSSRPDYLYKGKVKAIANSDVRLAVKAQFIYGSISVAGQTYFIEPLTRYDKTADKADFIFYASSAVANRTIPCGFNNANAVAANSHQQRKQQAEALATADKPMTDSCRKLTFLIAADYSMYKAFGYDADALQTFLLADLNMAEAVFNSFNLGADTSTDAGTDRLKFEVLQMHTAVCDSCDIVEYKTNQVGNMATKFGNWLLQNETSSPSYVKQFWTTRDLQFSTKSYIGYSYPTKVLSTGCKPWITMLKYFTQDPVMLRLQIAHETGHALGCLHDNEVKSSVTGFIMNAAVNTTATRFSSLADFGGGLYSADLTIRNTVLTSSCIDGSCTPTPCLAVNGLSVDYYRTADSVQLNWNGSGNFIVRYKVKDSTQFDPAHNYTVNNNKIILQNLSPCTIYTAEVKAVCNNNVANPANSITFAISPFSITARPANIRGDLYDLKLQLDCKTCGPQHMLVNIDHHPYHFLVSQFPAIVSIASLFADGARHRIDYHGDSIHSGCAGTIFYNAPYYRSNSIAILEERFNDCKLPAAWKDSSLLAVNNQAWLWAVKEEARYLNSFDDVFFSPGNLDSTCMLFCYNGNGSNAFSSSPMDINRYKNVYLSFDYKYLAYQQFPNAVPANAFFKAQAFDGRGWTDLFELTSQEIRPRGRRNIWDTIVPRKFINLDAYRNDQFQLRFVIDDGAHYNSTTGNVEASRVFTYLDNIKIDGYDSTTGYDRPQYLLFPNPASNKIFLKMNPVLSDNTRYTITDVSGRIVQKGKLQQYSVDISNLADAVYLLKLYKNDQSFGKPVKFIRHQLK